MKDRNDNDTNAQSLAIEGDAADAERARISALRRARRRFLVRSSILGTGAAVAPAAIAHSPATITDMTVTPSTLPAGGGDVVVTATVSADTSLLTLNGLPTTLPATIRVNESSVLTLAAYLEPSIATANVDVAPAPPPPSTTYNLTVTGPVYPYGEWFDHVVDARGRIIYSGHANKGSYGVGDNTIWAYDPVTDTQEVLYPNNGNKQGWVSGEIFVRFYIPELNWFIVQGQLIFDLSTNRIVASNIVARKTAAGVADGDTTPAFTDVFETEGSLWKNWMVSTPGQAAHDWCTARDAGVALGGYSSSTQVAVVFWKNPAYPQTSTKPLRLKCVYMPTSSRHPDDPARFGYPIRAQSGAKCRGDWLYVFAPIYKTDFGSLDWTQRRNTAMRLDVAAFLATPADSRVPNSGCERLPDIPANPANGDGFASCPAVTYDPVRDRLRHWNYKAWEFDPSENTYSDVTPDGYPNVAGWCAAYSSGAHYLSGGHRALDGSNYTYFLPSAPNSPPLTNGTPPYQDKTRFARIT